MNEPERHSSDLEELQRFVVGNPDLERLEALLDRFNIFEAIGVVRQELRHSDFLAFLLDPQQNHGLGDAFVKRLLQQAILAAPEASVSVSPIELSLWDLGRATVQREWQHIDILLLDEQNRLAVIIENKIGTGEHSGQLSRYYETVKQQHPGYKIVGLYLTPAGDEPSHEAYLPLSYGTVCEVLDSLAQSQVSVLNPDLKVLVTHYTEILRRHIVGDSEIARLAQQIYQKHQRAIDLIYEYRFAHVERVRQVLLSLVKQSARFVYEGRWADYPKHEFINFGVREWYKPALHVARGWTRSNLILMFCFGNWTNRASLVLQVGPGDEETRRRLLAMAKSDLNLFESDPSEWGGGRWINIFEKPMLTPEFYENVTDAEREAEIRRNWTDFVENDLPRIDAVLRKQDWIWESSETKELSEG